MDDATIRCGADLAIPSPGALRGQLRDLALHLKPRTIADVARDAGVRFRVQGGTQPVLVLWENPHGYTVRDDDGTRVYAVDRSGLPQSKRRRALRILEILAYGFQDYSARETVCGREHFVYPVTPAHGRLWLSEIGRRGGRSMTPAKQRASRSNGRTSAREGRQK